MKLTRRTALTLPAAAAAASAQTQQASRITRYVRFSHQGRTSYGTLTGDTIAEFSGGLFGARKPTGRTLKLAEVKLLYPCEPPKVFAVGLNYRSHLGDRPAPAVPEIFYKPTTSLLHPGDAIVVPPDSKNTHYEAELVIVIGKRVRNASLQEAQSAIFGYTCGNDVSERDWQKGDLQWWRAKGSDTFGPLGPSIVTDFDPETSSIQLRLNGAVKQQQKLSDLLFKPAQCVQFISKYVALEPGDVVYTGTPGTTTAMKRGDVVEVEIAGIGTLRNPVK